jgi:hypothetical protein
LALLAVSWVAVYQWGRRNGIDESVAKQKSALVSTPIKTSESSDQTLRTAIADERQQWINATYQLTLRNVGRNEWADFDQAGKVRTRYKEVGRTSDYIALDRSDIQQSQRIYANRAEVLNKDGKWGWIATGRWNGRAAQTAEPRYKDRGAENVAQDTKSAQDTKPAHAITRDEFRQKLRTMATTTGPNLAKEFGEPDRRWIKGYRRPASQEYDINGVLVIDQGGEEDREHLVWRCKDGSIELVVYSDGESKPLKDRRDFLNMGIETINDSPN